MTVEIRLPEPSRHFTRMLVGIRRDGSAIFNHQNLFSNPWATSTNTPTLDHVQDPAPLPHRSIRGGILVPVGRHRAALFLHPADFAEVLNAANASGSLIAG